MEREMAADNHHVMKERVFKARVVRIPLGEHDVVAVPQVTMETGPVMAAHV
jgi:hypothetical protein